MLLAKVHEHEVGMTGPVWDTERTKRVLQTLAALTDFINVTLHEILIVQGRRQTCQGDRVHVVRRSKTTDGTDLLNSTHQHADAQSRQPISLREGTRNEEIGDMTDLIEQSLSIESEVGFVNKNCGLRSRIRNTQEICSRCYLAGWIVGIRNHNHTGAVIQICKHIFRRKREVLFGKNRNRLRPRRAHEQLINAKRWHNDNRLIVRL